MRALLIAAALTAMGVFVLHLHALLAALLALNVVIIVYYAIDKSAAADGRERVPESTLHLLGVVGGSPGALLAQKLLRHKTSKREFQAVFWLICGVQLALLGWYLWRIFL